MATGLEEERGLEVCVDIKSIQWNRSWVWLSLKSYQISVGPKENLQRAVVIHVEACMGGKRWVV